MRGRPAETATGVAALGSLLAIITGVTDPQTLAAIITGLGMLPAGVSLFVDAGGVRGIARKVWRGKDASSTEPTA